MKLSVAIADSKAGPAAFVVWRGFASSMEKAARLGYQGVELALRTKEDVDVGELRSLLKQHNLEVSCISTGQVFADLNLYLTNPDAQRRAEAVRVLGGLVELAGEFGRMINLGRARGFVAEDQTEQEAEGLFLDAMGEILPIAEKHGVTVIIEPVNRYEINFINSVEQCASLLERAGLPNLGIMPDVFHMNIEDAQIGDSLIRHKDRIRYIHLADSNRLAPGWGHLDFEEVFDALRQADYNGWAAVEILPSPDPDQAAKQAVDYLRPFVERHNAIG